MEDGKFEKSILKMDLKDIRIKEMKKEVDDIEPDLAFF